MSGFLASGILLMSLGLPCVALGVHLRRDTTGNKKGKKRKQPGAASGPSGASLVVGGLLFSLVGAGFLALALMR